VIDGVLQLDCGGDTRVLRPGEAAEVPAGATHGQRPGDARSSRVRVQLRPAARGEAFLERLAELSAQGGFTRGGWLRPAAAAALIRDFGDEGHAAGIPLGVQRRLAAAVLRLTSTEYAFVDEWDVAAPIEAVFDALADPRTFPAWWTPVYQEVRADGPPAVGAVSHHRFKGRLPYELNVLSRIADIDAPHRIDTQVDGDLRGHGRWTLTETAAGGAHVRFDWTVDADRRLLRMLTPVLRPALAANHGWAVRRAIAGLEPYARRAAARTAASRDGAAPRVGAAVA
jgi:uncharacterized protein YndB with AHSA1/START domain